MEKNKNVNAEDYERFSTLADSKVFLGDKQMALASKFLNDALKEMGGNISWIKYAMGNGSHSSKYMGEVFGEAKKSRASQWLFLVNRVFWRLPKKSKLKLLVQYLKVLHALAFPNREKPVPRVTKDTDPDAVQRRRLDVNAQRNNQKHLNAIEDAAFSMLTELE